MKRRAPRLAAALVSCLASLAAAEADPFAGARVAIDGEVVHADSIAVRMRDAVLTVQDATAVPHLADGVLTLEHGAARAYGGAVTAEASVDLARGDQRWRIGVDGLDLASVLRALGGEDRGVGAVVDGWAEVTLPGGDASATSGHGELLLRDADLLRFGPLANLLIGDPGAAPHGDAAELRFDIVDRQVRLRSTRITSPSAVVVVRGTISLDGGLDLTLIPYLRFKSVKAVPGVGGIAAWLLGVASSRVARATVRGDLANPVVSLNPFAE